MKEKNRKRSEYVTIPQCFRPTQIYWRYPQCLLGQSKNYDSAEDKKKKRTFEENYYAHKIDTLPYHSSYMVAKIGSYILIIDIDYSWKKNFCVTQCSLMFFSKKKKLYVEKFGIQYWKALLNYLTSFLTKKSSIFGPPIKIHTV